MSARCLASPRSAVVFWLGFGGVAFGALTACGGSTSEEKRGDNRPSVAIDEDAGPTGSGASASSAHPGSSSASGQATSTSKPGSGPTSGSKPGQPSGNTGGSTGGYTGGGTGGYTGGGTGGYTGGGTGGYTGGGTGGHTAGIGGSGPFQPRPPIMIPNRPNGGVTNAENCSEPTEEKSAGSYCYAQQNCSNDSIYSSCSNIGGSNWQCNCGDYNRALGYTVTNADASVCLATLNLCTPGKEPEFGPTACGVEESPQVYSNSCSTQRSCTRSVDLGGGMQVSISDYQYANCQDNGEGVINCSCQTTLVGRAYDFIGTTLQAACTNSLDLCASAEEPEFTAEPKCVPSRSESAYNCSYSEYCTSQAEVQEGVSQIVAESPSASCYRQSEDGPWSCSCANPDISMNFEVAASQAVGGLCLNAFDLCTDFDPSKLPTEPPCSSIVNVTENSYMGTACDASAQCGHAVTLNGLDVTLYGAITTTCQAAEGGGWDCLCYGGSSSASLQIEADTDWDACAKAVVECPSVVPNYESNIGGRIDKPL
jgi:hypothetical protein